MLLPKGRPSHELVVQPMASPSIENVIVHLADCSLRRLHDETHMRTHQVKAGPAKVHRRSVRATPNQRVQQRRAPCADAHVRAHAPRTRRVLRRTSDGRMGLSVEFMGVLLWSHQPSEYSSAHWGWWPACARRVMVPSRLRRLPLRDCRGLPACVQHIGRTHSQRVFVLQAQ
jgi:hypothetical protein